MTGITLGVVDRIKRWGDEVSGKFLSGVYFEGARGDNLEVGIKELEDSAL